MRLFLLDVLLFFAALGAAWLGRKMLGKRVRGPIVVLWGIGFGFLGVFLGAWLLSRLDRNFIDLSNDFLAAFNFTLIIGWDVAILGGLLGAIIASWSRKRPQRP